MSNPEIIYTSTGKINPIIPTTIIKHHTDNCGRSTLPIWTCTITGGGKLCSVKNCVDSFGNIIIVGLYQHVKFDQDKLVNCIEYIYFYGRDGITPHELQVEGGYNMFIAKISYDGLILWSAAVLNVQNEVSYNLQTDKHSNIIIVSEYTMHPVIIDSTRNRIETVPKTFCTNCFILKIKEDGQFDWVTTVVSTSCVVSTSVSIDFTNSIYIGGYYAGSIICFNNQDKSCFLQLPTSTGSSGFIAKYSENGNALFAKKIGSTPSCVSTINRVTSLSVLPNSLIAVTGIFQANPLIFYNGPSINMNNNMEHDVQISLPTDNSLDDTDKLNHINSFIAVYNESGRCLMAHNILLFSKVSDYLHKNVPLIVASVSNSIYATGEFIRLDKPDLSDNRTSNKNRNNIFNKFSGGTNITNSTNITNIAPAIGTQQYTTVNTTNNINVTFNNNIIDNAYHNNNFLRNLTCSREKNVYLIKYTVDGLIKWITTLTADSSLAITGIDCDIFDNVVITGYFGYNILEFYNSSKKIASRISSNTECSSFTAKYDHNGCFMWATKQTAIFSKNQDVSILNNSSIVTGVYSEGNLIVNNSKGVVNYKLPIMGLVDGYIIKYLSVYQILTIDAPLVPYTEKTVILSGNANLCTLIYVNSSAIVDNNNICSIIMFGSNAHVFLVWSCNRWAITEYKNVEFVYC